MCFQLYLCEFCGKEHNGTYGSGRFCSARCSRRYSSNLHREEVNKKVSKTLKERYANSRNDSSHKAKGHSKKITERKNVKNLLVLPKEELEILAFRKGIDLSKLKPIKGFSRYFASMDGDVYTGTLEKLKPFNSSGYYQLKIKDDKDVPQVKGVHQLIALAFIPEYHSGCVVHHIDEDKHNNKLLNLQVMTLSEHCRFHSKVTLKPYFGRIAGWNKGNEDV